MGMSQAGISDALKKAGIVYKYTVLNKIKTHLNVFDYKTTRVL